MGRMQLLRYGVRILILVMLAGGLLAGSGLALALFSPIRPGAPGYGVQRVAERGLMAVTVGATGRADYALELLERRTAGLAAARARGSAGEAAAAQALVDQLEGCLPYLAEAPAADAPELRARFLAALERIQTALTASGPAPAALSQRVSTLLALVSDASIPLDRLQNGLVLAAPTPGPQPAVTPTAQVLRTISPHVVRFPPGSAGARHAFYALGGRHAQLDCADCHPDGRYAGTAHLCSQCHAADKPAGHYAAECDQCHTLEGWRPANFNHQAVDSGDCQSCHLGDRPANHYPGVCSACHSTSGWLPATFDHATAGAVDCAGCHLGARPANHFGGQCSMCHSTSTWAGATFNHSFPMNHGGAGGMCANCHSGDNGGAWSCFRCHNEGELSKKHNEEGIPDYASRCLACHANGQEGDDD